MPSRPALKDPSVSAHGSPLPFGRLPFQVLLKRCNDDPPQIGPVINGPHLGRTPKRIWKIHRRFYGDTVFRFSFWAHTSK